MTNLETFAAMLLSAPAHAAKVEHKLRLHLADTVGAMIAGAHSAEGSEIAKTGASPALFGDNLFDRVALRVAQTRLTEIDDIHMASCTTVGSVVTPVVLTLAADMAANDERIAAGISAGYDAMVRLGAAVDGARILYKGIWPTYLVAPFSAAAATAAVLGLDGKATAHALALALAQITGAAGGPSAGRNPRWLYAGWGAASGMRSAFAARDGYAGDLGLLDGDWLETTHGIAFDPAKLKGEPGEALFEMSIKPWCTAKQACAALAGFIELLDGGIDPAAITAVRIFVPSAIRGMIAHGRPGRLGRIVAISWQCALAAFHRQELLDIERADHSHEGDFAALMRKVEVLADTGLEGYFPQLYPARVEIELASGEVRETMVLDAPGDPGNALDAAGIESKFMQVTRPLQRASALFEDAMKGRYSNLSQEIARALPFA